ncbi:roadblock/LC7 domain-containing protein [Streptomyces sp. NPDC056061]|uniref:roadblock/LC7 domain-containing protein n=1 Tax=Streptomyces sp. NPDC056061 TaxID=3345700 RepID=UPI0035DDF07E
MTTVSSSNQQDLAWMLDQIKGLHGVSYVLVLSSDGLAIAQCTELDKNTADSISAAAAGYCSIGKALGQFGGGPMRQCMGEYENAVIFVTSVAENSLLVVQCTHDADISVVAGAMESMAPNMAKHLASKARTGGSGGAALSFGTAGQS